MHNFVYETFYDLCKKMHLSSYNRTQLNTTEHHSIPQNTTTLKICNFKNTRSKIIIKLSIGNWAKYKIFVFRQIK